MGIETAYNQHHKLCDRRIYFFHPIPDIENRIPYQSGSRKSPIGPPRLPDMWFPQSLIGLYSLFLLYVAANIILLRIQHKPISERVLTIKSPRTLMNNGDKSTSGLISCEEQMANF